MARVESIMQKRVECYICGKQDVLHCHHAMHGYANRKKADMDGLWVWLCPRDHMDLHDHGIHDDELKQDAQRAWMKTYRKDKQAWIDRYGKSFL